MKKLLTRGVLLVLLCAALALPALADSVTDSISVCIGYFGWAEDEYVEKQNLHGRNLTTGTAAHSTRTRNSIPIPTAAAGHIWSTHAGFTSAICWITRASM